MNWVYVSAILLVWFLPVPTLVVAALRKWVQSPRNDTPSWRNTLGLASMIAILCSWLLIVVLTLIQMSHESLMSVFTDTFYLAFLVFVAAATLAAFTLKGKPRIFATAAGFINMFMAALWFLKSGAP
jgi:hypothetical protein